MHPFGMNVEVDFEYPDTVPVPPSRAGAEVMEWVTAQQAEIADVELPEGPDDFVLSMRRWLRYLDPKYRPFVYAWIAALNRARRVPISAASIKRLQGMMRRDVQESVAMLWDAKPGVIDAWRKWYPEWVASLIAERAKADPMFLLPAEDYRRRKLGVTRRDDLAKKQAARDADIGARLHKHLETHGGICRWRPGLLAEKISSRQRGKRVDAGKVREMAAALVRVGAAEWKRQPNGRVWAITLLNATALNH